MTPAILMSGNDNISASQSNATPEGDLEDTISGKSPCRPILSEVLINGKFVSKLAALASARYKRFHASTHLHQPFPQMEIIWSMTVIWVNHVYGLEIWQLHL